MVIHPEGIFYPQVKEEKIPDIVEQTIKNGEVVEMPLTFKDPATKRESSTNGISLFTNFSRGSSSETTA